jgi:hypothetical protein
LVVASVLIATCALWLAQRIERAGRLRPALRSPP